VSWAIGEGSDGRDIGYGVPATCDFPKCGAAIDRGLSYVCGGEPHGGDHGCGRFFCGKHLTIGRFWKPLCSRCRNYRPPFDPTPDVQEWIDHKATDPSWSEWRKENGIPEPKVTA
jgi:hypothetical protein